MNKVKSFKIKPLFYLFFMLIVLCNPTGTFRYAFQGLTQWATRMVPTLFPFMMLSSMMLYSGADKELGDILRPCLKILYRLSSYCLYAVFVGFLCGFPMGAKAVSELYGKGRISKKEANLLLSFCNNIGPSYFLGMILPLLQTCGYCNSVPFLFGMYGIPAMYGAVLSWIYNRKNINYMYRAEQDTMALQQENEKNYSTSEILRLSCLDNTQSLIILGGYITFVNAFRVILDLLPISLNMKAIISSFLEIISGVQAIYTLPIHNEQKIFYIMTALSFSGVSCLLQTCCFLEKEKLSMIRYLAHRILLTMISAIYYYVLLF